MLRELDVRESGSFAHRVEGALLAELRRRHGTWPRVAFALGRATYSQIQRAVERHPEL